MKRILKRSKAHAAIQRWLYFKDLKVDRFGLRTETDVGVKGVKSLFELATGMGAARLEKGQVSTPALFTRGYSPRVHGDAQRGDEFKEAWEMELEFLLKEMGTPFSNLLDFLDKRDMATVWKMITPYLEG